MDRRAFLTGMGSATLLIAGTGFAVAYRDGVFSLGKGPAFTPWIDWQESGGSAIALVKAAILAASPHNTQPWLFRVEDTYIEIFIDAARNVGALDPYLREEHIGIGCAIENLALSAPANGYIATISTVSGTLSSHAVQRTLLARVELRKEALARSDLYAMIPHRHTNRGPYHLTPLPPDFLDDLAKMADSESDAKIFVFTDEQTRRQIAEMVWNDNNVLYSDPNVEHASETWIRRTSTQVQSHRDGLTMDELGRPAFVAAASKVLSAKELDWAFSHRLLKRTPYRDVLAATPLFGLIAVRDRYDKTQCLTAGRLWQRAHLTAVTKGLAGRPVNESVEMIDFQRSRNQTASAMQALQSFIGSTEWQPTFMFRFGHPVLKAGPSPRRAADSVLV